MDGGLKDAQEFASAIVGAAILFAKEVCTPAPGNFYGNSLPDPNVVIGKHVEAQLAFFASQDRDPFVKAATRVATVLEDGVRVKATQPWHRDARERD